MKKYVRGAIFVLFVLLIFAAPNLVWRLQKAKTLEVAIVDKTVPFRKYREHAAIPWLLHALKIHGNDGRFLDERVDYIGYDPASSIGTDLTAAHLWNADVLVITDTYGVYKGDYERPGEQAALERSPKIYGGMTMTEALLVKEFVAKGGLAIAEFNTFASPTEEAPRAVLEGVFGAKWKHWVARYWPDLQDPNEVPHWVGDVYRRVTGTPFDFKGAGLVFVKEDRDMVVLQPGDELGPKVVTQERTSLGAAYDLPERGSFWYWMDVVEATEADILYEHVLDISPEGQKRLARHGLPVRFPAVTKWKDAWYFAGDFVDSATNRGNPERGLILPWKRNAVTLGCGTSASPEESFFWAWYAPIVGRLFATRAR